MVYLGRLKKRTVALFYSMHSTGGRLRLGGRRPLVHGAPPSTTQGRGGLGGRLPLFSCFATILDGVSLLHSMLLGLQVIFKRCSVVLLTMHNYNN